MAVLLSATAGLLCGDVLVAFTRARSVGVVIALVAIVALVVEGRRMLLLVVERHGPRRWWRVLRAATEMLLYLSPIAMLSVVYPIASHRLNITQVGGVRLTTLLLASSVTVPWLTQAVCLPLYRAVAPHVAAEEHERIVERLCEVWPTTFVQCLPIVVLFAVPMEISQHWSSTALATYLCLCILYVAFAQSLILSIIFRRRGLWAVAWAGVALALLIAPTVWFLPPLVGLVTQLLPLWRRRALLLRPVRLQYADVAQDALRGLLLGAVLWSDKYFLFVKAGNRFAVTSVYMALLPAVLAYNYYFVRLAPRFDASIMELRRAMEEAPYTILVERSRAVYQFVTRSLYRSALVGAAIAAVVTVLIAALRPGSVALVAAVAVASWLAMMITLLCYQLDYIGQSGIAQALSGVYLVGCVSAFVFLPAVAAPYVALIAFDVLLCALTLRTTLAHWRSPEYSLFWRHATAW
jgi:hypothetical protein